MITLSYNYLAVVVPTFNRKDITLQFIKSLNSQPIPLRIYVCDSGSTDGTAFAVMSEPNVKLVSAGSSAWWSAAVNEGIREANKDGAKLFLVMNDDIEFDQNIFSILLSCHIENPMCIISPIQQTESGVFIGTIYEGIFQNIRNLDDVPEDGLIDTSNGCCLLIPRRVFEVLGNFDDHNCPHLYGDTEFQLRAKRAGFMTKVCSAAAVRQMSATDYFSRLQLLTLFTFEGSPIHWRAYKTFGGTLFKSYIKFIFFGFNYHFSYLKTLIKILKFLATKNIKLLKKQHG